jgi:hypothetical protein
MTSARRTIKVTRREIGIAAAGCSADIEVSTNEEVSAGSVTAVLHRTGNRIAKGGPTMQTITGIVRNLGLNVSIGKVTGPPTEASGVESRLIGKENVAEADEIIPGKTSNLGKEGTKEEVIRRIDAIKENSASPRATIDANQRAAKVRTTVERENANFAASDPVVIRNAYPNAVAADRAKTITGRAASERLRTGSNMSSGAGLAAVEVRREANTKSGSKSIRGATAALKEIANLRV